MAGHCRRICDTGASNNTSEKKNVRADTGKRSPRMDANASVIRTSMPRAYGYVRNYSVKRRKRERRRGREEKRRKRRSTESRGREERRRVKGIPTSSFLVAASFPSASVSSCKKAFGRGRGAGLVGDSRVPKLHSNLRCHVSS